MKNTIFVLAAILLVGTMGACNRQPQGGSATHQYATGNPERASGPDTMDSSTHTLTATATVNDVMHDAAGTKNEGSGLHTTGTAHETGTR